ncbi:MAG: prephenate dehydratase [Paludibacter sp.]|jgi:prephenate dehydratase|nr:prephenate dehydratase [Paludibacter sp.]
MKRIAIQGVSGAFHDIAARQFFSEEEVEIIPCITFKEVFDAVQKSDEVLGIVAIENTIAGSLLQNYNLLRESGGVVVGEHKLRISHCICALPGQKLEEISEVYSHPIALRQCEDFLEHHHHLRAVESDDTALSAKEIADQHIVGRAAICSSFAAQLYGLDILADGIETNKRNFTRFLVVAHPDHATRILPSIQVDKSSIVFTLPHEEGSLAKVLSILSFYRVNLTKIQSLPILGREWEYQFYISLTFDNYERYRQSLDAVRPLLKDFQVLGEYREAPTPIDN